MFGLKRKTPEFIRSEYLRKQLQVIEETDNPVVRHDAVIRLATHLGDLSVLGNQRTTDLVSGEGRSLSEAEVLEVVRQVRGILGGVVSTDDYSDLMESMEMMTTITKTLEFKIRFTDSQLEMVNQYLEISRQIWNYALGCLIDHEQFVKAYRDFEGDKPGWAAAPCCPLPWKYRRIDWEKGWIEGNIAPFSPITEKSRPYRPCCPLPQDYKQPALGLSLLGKYSLQYHLTQKNHPNWQDLKTIGSWYVRGVCDSLFTAWKLYQKGDRGKPRFKRYNEGYDCLIYGDGAKLSIRPVNTKDARINIPRVGEIKVPYLYQDLGELPIAVLRILRKSDGWYLQIVCSKYPANAKPGKVSMGLVPVAREGILAVDDRGNEYTVTPDERLLLQRRERLQQKAARQRRAIADMRLQGKPVKGSNLKATERKIARISALLAARRKAEQQKIASFLTRKSKAIAVVQPNAKFIPHPKPKTESGELPLKYESNGAKRVATANKERAQYAVGQFVEIIRQKSTETGTEYTKVNKKPKEKSKIENFQALAKAIKS